MKTKRNSGALAVTIVLGACAIFWAVMTFVVFHRADEDITVMVVDKYIALEPPYECMTVFEKRKGGPIFTEYSVILFSEVKKGQKVRMTYKRDGIDKATNVMYWLENNNKLYTIPGARTLCHTTATVTKMLETR